MTITETAISKGAHFLRSKSFRTNAGLALSVIMVVILAGITVATAQTYTDLYNFDGTHGNCPPNAEPCGFLAQGRDGNLYGTTYQGGTNNDGVIFKITPSGTLEVLYNFDGGVDGGSPYSGLTLGTGGNFYGTTGGGGANGDGTIFKITKSGILTTLYSLATGDGADPYAPPIQGADGNLYGTTFSTAYKVTPSGTFTLLASLHGQSEAPLLQGTDGHFYGTTYDGGWRCWLGGCGTAFKMTSKGILTRVYNFGGWDGEHPSGPLIEGSDGNFYGTTYGQSGNGGGVVFKLTRQGAFMVLHNFGDPNYPNDGRWPYAGLVEATDGNFYGATTGGGTGVCNETWGSGCGVIFQITPAGAYSILYNFDGIDGAGPWSTPVQHTNGKIYGLAAYGGTAGDGVVYSFDLGLAPFVSLVSTSGKIGKTVEVLGQGFTGTTAVSFNGTAASFKVWSDTFLEATVPSGATTGPVTVTTPGGTLTSNHPFRVRP